MKRALLIIDVQNDYFEGGKMELHNPTHALENIATILRKFRESGEPIIHVQHINTRPGATFFLPDSEGAAIHQSLTPQPNEHLVIKHAPSSFLGTNLLNIAKELGVTQFVVCGMMTHMCVDTTVRACMDLNIGVTLIDDACATRDLAWQGKTLPAETVHEVFMASLDGIFATVIKTASFE